MTTHTVPAGTMSAAFQTRSLQDQLKAIAPDIDKVDLDAPKPFLFDPIDAISGIRSEGFKKNLLNSLIFSINGLITGMLRSTLGTIKNHVEETDAPMWDSYQEFLHVISGLEVEHEWFAATGVEHAHIPRDMQRLADLRGECFRILNGDKLDTVVPSIEDVIKRPQPRNLSAETLTKLEIATEEEFDSKEDREEAMAASLRKEAQQRKLRHEADKRQVGALLALWRAFNIRDDRHEASYDGEFVPFTRMSKLTQLKLLRGMINAVTSALSRGESDFTVSAVEYRKWRVEAKPYKAEVEAAAAHERFDEIHDAVFG